MTIRVTVPLKPNSNVHHRLIYGDKRFKRPRTMHNLVLETEMHTWMKKHSIKYSLDWAFAGTFDYFSYAKPAIVFENNTDAVLFKLTWC